MSRRYLSLQLTVLVLAAAGCRGPERRPIFESQPVPPPSTRPVLPVSPAPPPGAFQPAPAPPPNAVQPALPPGAFQPAPAPPPNAVQPAPPPGAFQPAPATPPNAVQPAPPPGAFQPAPAPAPTAVQPAPAPPPGANQPAPAPPPSAFPTAPPAAPPTPAAQPQNPPVAPPGPSGAAAPSRDAIAQIEHRWQPAESGAGGVRLGAPEPITAGDPKSPARLYPPNVTGEPPLRDGAGTRLPVGIRQFATAMNNVTVGLRPSGQDGLDWLKANGYRSVLHVRLPGDDDSADKKQAESHGMKYLSLEVSPRSLTKETVQEFARIVADTSSHPLFVYDADGSLAGGLWYLYFRVNQQLSNDVARVRAGALGLRENEAGTHRDMWLAIQRYLSDAER